MSRRTPELQALDLASWPAVAWTDFDAKERQVIKMRMQAIERFARGEPVKGIEQSTGVNRRQLSTRHFQHSYVCRKPEHRKAFTRRYLERCRG